MAEITSPQSDVIIQVSDIYKTGAEDTALAFTSEEFVEHGFDWTTMVFQHQETRQLRLAHVDGLRAWVEARLGHPVSISYRLEDC